MSKKLFLTAAGLVLSFGLAACAAHDGMMKDDKGMEMKDGMMKDEKMRKDDSMMK